MFCVMIIIVLEISTKSLLHLVGVFLGRLSVKNAPLRVGITIIIHSSINDNG